MRSCIGSTAWAAHKVLTMDLRPHYCRHRRTVYVGSEYPYGVLREAFLSIK